MTFRYLLAKSSGDPLNPQHWETLIGHTEHTIGSAKVLFDVVGCKTFESFLETDFEIFRQGLLTSAWLHDLGKANDHFQKAVRGKREKQGIRHDTLGLVLSLDIFHDWLAGFWKRFPDWFKPAVLLALCGHHLKFPDSKARPGTEVHFLGGHKDFREFIKVGVELLGLPDSPTFSDKTYSLLATDSDGIDKKLFRIRRNEIFDRDWDFSQKRFVAVLKSMLMCADLAGSALPKKSGNIQEWLKERCKKVLHQSELKEVVEKKIRGSPLRHFQQKIQEVSTPTVLLEAGCGAGKTVAAYLWAEKFAVDRRLFFCYPTTATASEGFSGYLREPAFEAILKHSRVDVDYRLLENMPERSLSSQRLHAQQLEAIDTWPVPVVVCTAHAVLGILQNYRTGIYSFPSIVRSAFVFDEIHSFSSKLFQHLLRFLEIFSKVPVLLMTATLPAEKKNELLKLAEKRGGIEILQGAKEREEAKRYVLHQSTFEENWAYVKESVRGGGKVLWVCNTVSRAIAVVKLALEGGFPVKPFHSRFKYRDRLKRQREVIDGFLPGKPPMLAITTQVAEMSLDISADVLISEYAPIPAMIQRLGRLNRFEDIPEVCKNAYFYKPENLFPYASQKEEAEELSNDIENWLAKIADRTPKSQKDLFEAFLRVPEKRAEFTESVVCEWFDDPWLSRENQKSIMEAGYTIDLILQEDLESKNLQEVVLPMPFPKRADSQNWSWKGRFLIAPTGTVKYDEFTGGEYADRQNDPWII